MSLDLGALTGSVVVGLPGVQACLLVSRDGLPLSAFPLGEERRVMEVWLRLAELGDAERGFVVVGGQMWAFSVRGFYGTVAVAAPSVRPGLLLDRLDRVLARLAEESTAEPAHRLVPAEERTAAPERPQTPPRPRPEGPPPEPDHRVREEVRPARPAPAPQPEGEPTPAETRRGSDDEDDTQPGAKVASVDAIALAREFAGLISEEEAG